ncbi:hypothetical protein GF324_01320 [bacterium]|nr:hypothetical protein [bacterium]
MLAGCLNNIENTTSPHKIKNVEGASPVKGNQEAEQKLQVLLEGVDREFAPYRDKKQYAEWIMLTRGNDEAIKTAVDTDVEYRKKLGNPELFTELTERLSDPGIQDQMLRRWAFLLRLEIAGNRLSEEVIEDLVKREKKIQTVVNGFRPTLDGQTVSMNRIREILSTSRNMEERKQAWEASKELGPLVETEIRELTRARNLAARSMGFPDHYRMQLEIQEIDEARLFSLLGRFAGLSEEPFRRMKARLDRLIADHFQSEAIDLSPWHYGDPYFRDCPPVFGVDLDPIFRDRNTIDWVTRYFDGIGLPLDQIIAKGDYQNHDGKSPHAMTMNLNRDGDVRALMNVVDDSYWAAGALHVFGAATYYLNIESGLPHTMRTPAHPSVVEAIAAFFDRNALDLEWLTEMFALTGEEIRGIARPLREMLNMRQAIQSRWMLVMIHFERGLYRDPDHDQQQRWWDLVERFQLLRQPVERGEKADWACETHFAIQPIHYHNYLLGTWIASQFEDQMASDLGLERPVIWQANDEIGEWLTEKVFKHGAYWEFTELVRNITGSSPIPDPFVEQFFM